LPHRAKSGPKDQEQIQPKALRCSETLGKTQSILNHQLRTTSNIKRLIIPDIHAKQAGLDAVLNHEGSRDRVIFLGEAISAGPHSGQLAGNHETGPFWRNFTGEGTGGPGLHALGARPDLGQGRH